jgi:hypothetical protein
MDTRRRLLALHARWGIPFDEEAELTKLQNRVLVVIDRCIGKFLLEHPSVSTRVAYLLGQSVRPTSSITRYPIADLSLFVARTLDSELAYTAVRDAKSKSDLVQALQCLFWALEGQQCGSLDELTSGIDQAMRDSLTLNMRILRKSHVVTILPAGSRLLDEKVVSDVLSWLAGHPKSLKQFEQALQLHLTGDSSKRRAVLDYLRHSLEQLLRSVLKNNARLEDQNRHILPWLRARRVNQEAISMLATLLGQFAKYQNAVVKHDDRSAPVEVEFLIYLTGTFMRFLLEAERDFKTETARLEDMQRSVAKSVREAGRLLSQVKKER